MSDCITIKIGKYQMGGPEGTFPTAMFGTIFFAGQELLHDSETGEFDWEAALKQIESNQSVCREFAIPLYLDVVAETPEAVSRQVGFVASETDLPFLIDASDEDVRMAGLQKAVELSALERTVYNSIYNDSADKELELIAQHPPAAIVIGAMDAMNYGLESALDVVTEIKGRLPDSLHDRLLLDVGFLDEATAGVSCAVAKQLRAKTGLPVGGAPSNGLHMWETLKSMGETHFVAALAGTIGYCTAFGLDFLFIGPLRYAKLAVAAQGAADVYNRYKLMLEDRGRSLPQEHPIKAMFQR